MNNLARKNDLSVEELAQALAFTTDDPRANYISNSDRSQIIEAMQEFIDRNKSNQ
jgi:hypothetical protein